MKYILEGHTAVPCDDTLTWARCFEKHADRVVGLTEYPEVSVSTVFIGIDHRVCGEGPPILFETMVFGGELDGELERCSTWDEAVEMHERMVARVKTWMP
jgi:hypothetical protein